MKKITVILIAILNASYSPSQIKTNSKSVVANPTFLISDGTAFKPKAYYPNFSWEVTPQYVMFADGDRLLTPNEVTEISDKTGFICIEKNHAWTKFNYAELGAKHEIAAFKAVNPSIKALYYFNSAYAWPFTSYNENFVATKIDEHPELKQFLIVNKNTGELEKRETTFFFDVLNPEFRRWWVETVVQGVRTSGADGVFIDQMHGFVWLRSSQETMIKEAMGEMMADLKKALGPDKIVLGNNASHVEKVFPVIDAAMFEHYDEKTLSKENLLNEWDYMLANAKAGKISVFRIGVEAEENPAINGLTGTEKEKAFETLSKERLEYYQACYLIGAQPYSYFQYGWGWRLHTGPLTDYPALLKPLGTPKGPYKRVVEKSWEFTREFEHASVWLDTEHKKAKITWSK